MSRPPLVARTGALARRRWVEAMIVVAMIVLACSCGGSTSGGSDVTPSGSGTATSEDEASTVFDATFHVGRWSQGRLSEDGTVLTIEFGSIMCYRAEHRTSAYEEGGKVVVRLEWRAMEEPPIACLAIGGPTLMVAVPLPRVATPGEIIDAYCPDPNYPPPQTTQLPPGVSLPEPKPTSPGDCHLRPILVGAEEPPGPESPEPSGTLPPLDSS